MSSNERRTYGKLHISDYDEEDPLCIGLQVMQDEPEILKPPATILSKNKPDNNTLNMMTRIKMEILESLDKESSCSILVVPLKFTNRILFDDMVAFLADRETRRTGLIPMVVVNSLDCLSENTENNLVSLRKSCFLAYKRNVAVCVILNSFIGVTYFSDISTAALLNDIQYAPLGSITSLPVLCSTMDLVKKCQEMSYFFGMGGEGTVCSFCSTGNRRAYDVSNTECRIVFSHSSALGHHLLPLAKDTTELASYFG